MLVGKNCHLICSNLIKDMTCAKHSISSYNNVVNYTPRHHVPNSSISYQADINTIMQELKSSKTRPLHHGASFCCNHAQAFARFSRSSYDSKGSTICNGSKRTGVAVSKHFISILD